MVFKDYFELDFFLFMQLISILWKTLYITPTQQLFVGSLGVPKKINFKEKFSTPIS